MTNTGQLHRLCARATLTHLCDDLCTHQIALFTA